MTEKEKMLAGKIYDSSDKELAELRTKAHKLSQQYSSLYEDDERRNAILDELLPDHGEGFFLQGPVYFDYGVDTFIEIGPGKTLSSFVRKIDRNVKVYNIEKPEDLDRVMEELAC